MQGAKVSSLVRELRSYIQQLSVHMGQLKILHAAIKTLWNQINKYKYVQKHNSQFLGCDYFLSWQALPSYSEDWKKNDILKT